MSVLDYKWYVGSSEELFNTGPLDTREEAVHIAKEEYEGAWIIEAYKRPVDLSNYFDVDFFLENAEEAVYDMGNEDDIPVFDITHQQAAHLQAVVRTAIQQWQAEQNLVFLPWAFTDQRNLEFIDGEVADTRLPNEEADA